MYRNLTVTAEQGNVDGANDPNYAVLRGGKVVQTTFPIPIEDCGWFGRPDRMESGRPLKRARVYVSSRKPYSNANKVSETHLEKGIGEVPTILVL